MAYTYEEVQPKIETTETPESHLLHVHIPDGFVRGDIGAKVEYDFGRVRVFGERSIIGSNKRIRFNEKHQVPSYCDINNIKGKFDGNIITITMPIIPGKAPPKQEQKAPPPTPEPVVQESRPKEENDKETIPPQSTSTEDNNAAATATDEVKDQKGVKQQDTSDKQDPKSTVESKENAGHEEQKVTMPQKGEEESSKEAQVTKVDHHETSTTPEATEDSMSQKGHATHEGIVSHKATFTTDAKLQTEENTEGINEQEGKEKETVGKEETKDNLKKTTTAESGKPSVVDDDSSPNPEKEIKKESKVFAAIVESVTTMNREKEKRKEMNGKFGDGVEKKSDKWGIPDSTRTRIKDMAASTTQAVTRLAKRLNNEEDKQKLIYTGAAILVVGLSVYATYKYRSSPRP